jgi:hypothetical protein
MNFVPFLCCAHSSFMDTTLDKTFAYKKLYILMQRKFLLEIESMHVYLKQFPIARLTYLKVVDY